MREVGRGGSSLVAEADDEDGNVIGRVATTLRNFGSVGIQGTKDEKSSRESSRDSLFDEFRTRFLRVRDSRVLEQVDSFLITDNIPELFNDRNQH